MLAGLLLVVPLVVLVFPRGAGRLSVAPPPGPTAGQTTPAPTAPAQGATWRRLPPAGISGGGSTSAWTGIELVIFDVVAEGDGMAMIGVAYDPTRNTWRRLPPSPYPVRMIESGERAVWTGSEVLLFGLMNAAYNPTTNRWRPLAPGPAWPSVVVWTGRQILTWGGGCCGTARATGSAYDPAMDAWQPIPTGPLAARYSNGVWTGTEMVVMGGAAQETLFADGAAYNPSTRSWRRLPPLPSPRTRATLTWTGAEVIVAGGMAGEAQSPVVQTDALAYNPATDRWRRLSAMPVPRLDHVAVWTGSRLLVWGGISTLGEVPAVPPHGVSFDPTTDSWSAMPASPLKGRREPVHAWTGTELIIWGGSAVPGPAFDDGAAYRP